MALSKLYKKEKPDVSDQSLLREVFPDNGPKRLARLMDVPIRTAKHWFYVSMSTARRQELAAKLLKELDEQDRRREAQDRRRQELRQKLIRIVGGHD